LFDSGEGERRAGNISRVKGQVGRLQRDQASFVRLKPHHAALAKARIIGHADDRKGLTAEGVAGIKNGDGLLR
jgi:hypothetical protein